MEIREASVRDIDLVVDLVSAMLRDMASYGGHALNDAGQVSALLRARFAESAENEEHVYLLAAPEGEGEPIGVVEASAFFQYELFQPKSLVHVHSLYVKPSHRGNGIGRRLLEAVLDWGKAKGCVEAKLNVLAGNPARSLYKSAGFSVFELEVRRGL